MEVIRIEVNGAPATLDDLRRVATINYGHFTAMQVRDGGVRGLSQHLARLDEGTRALFGCALDPARVRAAMRTALAGVREASLRVQVFSRALDRERLYRPLEPDLLVVVSPPTGDEPAPPLAVRCVRYARELPEVKHVATFGLFHQRRLAQRAGYDDALFETADGAISEGTTWNVGFEDDDGILWPEAPMLAGIVQRIVADRLEAAGLPQRRARITRAVLARCRGAFALNSAFIVRPLASIDGTTLGAAAGLVERLRALHDAVVPEPP